jgi:hypothetical protein
VTSLTKRELDPAVEERPRDAPPATGPEPANAFDRLCRRFADPGGVDLELPQRHAGRAWGGFFDGTAASDDLMRERQQPPTQERDEL